MWTNTNCDSEILRYERGVSQMMTISDEGGIFRCILQYRVFNVSEWIQVSVCAWIKFMFCDSD